MTTLKMFRWFWAWDDEKEENWLREMAQKGWHFQSVTLPGSYVFEQGEPKDTAYRLDYLTDSKDKPNYLQLFLDAGWEYKGEMNGWQYFSKECVDGEAPEIFSDPESKAKKYERLMLYLIIFLPVYFTFLNTIDRADSPFTQALALFFAAIMMFYAYAMVRLFMRVQKLKKKI